MFGPDANGAKKTDVIQYRTFRNSDPPRILKLWQACELGRGAARPFSTDVFEVFNYSQQFFDREGLILASDEEGLVGFAHAGFGFRQDESGLDRETGVVCAIMVHPRRRREGIGRELLSRAEAYLRDAGAREIRGGSGPGADPFYFGLYGGSRPSGFLASDPLAEPFFLGNGYESFEKHSVFQRNLTETRDPVSVRLMSVRRQTELAIADVPTNPTWWWYTHFGRWDSVGIDSLRFRLIPKGGGEPLAAVTVIGLDQYIPVWQQRAIGLVDVHVDEARRGQGYGQALLVEVLKRLRQELITVAEIHAPESNEIAIGVIRATGFELVDTGVVYRKRAT
jgi:ribosomal protein S18 acetylase RimI-like enzyme